MSTVRVALPILHCYRCFYSWHPKTEVVRICPRCKSPHWNVPEIRRPPYAGGGLGVAEIVAPKRKEIHALVRKYHFSNPRVFGSVARGEASPKSDVDILVKPHGGGLWELAGLRVDLRELLGRPVDVVPEDSLKWYVAPEVLAQAVPL
jgi:uncharacterized protein